MSDKEAEAQLKLASAMERLADKIEKFQDPIVWQKLFSEAARTLPGLPISRVQPQTTLLTDPSVDLVTVSLSNEEREEFVEQVFSKLQPQLAEFNGFVKKSLKDMPAHRLKLLAKRIEEGHPPKLDRRQGCVFVTMADRDESGCLDEFYLGL